MLWVQIFFLHVERPYFDVYAWELVDLHEFKRLLFRQVEMIFLDIEELLYTLWELVYVLIEPCVKSLDHVRVHINLLSHDVLTAVLIEQLHVAQNIDSRIYENTALVRVEENMLWDLKKQCEIRIDEFIDSLVDDLLIKLLTKVNDKAEILGIFQVYQSFLDEIERLGSQDFRQRHRKRGHVVMESECIILVILRDFLFNTVQLKRYYLELDRVIKGSHYRYVAL